MLFDQEMELWYASTMLPERGGHVEANGRSNRVSLAACPPLHDLLLREPCSCPTPAKRVRLAASADYVRGIWSRQKVLVIGRHQFDLTDGWERHPPAGDHVVVVSHRPRPTGRHPEASYHFAPRTSGCTICAYARYHQKG